MNNNELIRRLGEGLGDEHLVYHDADERVLIESYDDDLHRPGKLAEIEPDELTLHTELGIRFNYSGEFEARVLSVKRLRLLGDAHLAEMGLDWIVRGFRTSTEPEFAVDGGVLVGRDDIPDYHWKFTYPAESVEELVEALDWMRYRERFRTVEELPR